MDSATYTYTYTPEVEQPVDREGGTSGGTYCVIAWIRYRMSSKLTHFVLFGSYFYWDFLVHMEWLYFVWDICVHVMHFVEMNNSLINFGMTMPVLMLLQWNICFHPLCSMKSIKSIPLSSPFSSLLSEYPVSAQREVNGHRFLLDDWCAHLFMYGDFQYAAKPSLIATVRGQGTGI